MAVITLSAVLHQEEDLYVAECPEVGTVSQGYTIEEALANLKEATELYLEWRNCSGLRVDHPLSEFVENAEL
jgi:predicted RNase H-like HicB family nuclease